MDRDTFLSLAIQSIESLRQYKIQDLIVVEKKFNEMKDEVDRLRDLVNTGLRIQRNEPDTTPQPKPKNSA